MAGADSYVKYTRKMPDTGAAEKLFDIARQRLLDVSHWKDISKGISSDFNLTDSDGKKANREAHKGDYFQISIPGPGIAAGDGNDWVQVESIDHHKKGATEFISITVRPAPNPLNSSTETAHFFENKATSTFKVSRTGTLVKAEVLGKNESPNTEMDHVTDKIRNLIVATGAILGLSRPQWKGLVEGLLGSDQ
jgi:hypothetical protein